MVVDQPKLDKIEFVIEPFWHDSLGEITATDILINGISLLRCSNTCGLPPEELLFDSSYLRPHAMSSNNREDYRVGISLDPIALLDDIDTLEVTIAVTEKFIVWKDINYVDPEQYEFNFHDYFQDRDKNCFRFDRKQYERALKYPIFKQLTSLSEDQWHGALRNQKSFSIKFYRCSNEVIHKINAIKDPDIYLEAHHIPYIHLENSVDGLCFLLSEQRRHASAPISEVQHTFDLLFVGEHLISKHSHLGTVHHIMSDSCSAIYQQMEQMNVSDLERSFDPKLMTAAKVNPNVWNHCPKLASAWLLSEFFKLSKFLSLASTEKQGIVLIKNSFE